jgi:hypothetical protein
MPLEAPTREEIVAFISTLVKVPAAELTDDTKLGPYFRFLPYIVLNFGKAVVTDDASNFTIGDLIAQLNKK